MSTSCHMTAVAVHKSKLASSKIVGGVSNSREDLPAFNQKLSSSGRQGTKREEEG